MKAGKTDIEVGTKVITNGRWLKKGITGSITHPFGSFGGSDYGAVAGIRIDKEFRSDFGEIGNLFKNDFKVIKQ